MNQKIYVVVIGLLALVTSGCQQSDKDSAVIEAARAGYIAFQQGDMAAWAETQASDVEWIAPKSLPYAGTYYGPQAVMDNVFAPIVELWPDFEVEAIEYKASGNTVYVTTRIRAGGAVSESLHVATIENGKYTKFQIYDDGGFMMQSALADNHESEVGYGGKPFVLIARMQSKLESANDVVELSGLADKAVKASEPGMLLHTFEQDPHDPLGFVWTEVYADSAALIFHLENPPLQNYLSEVSPLLDSFTVVLYGSVSEEAVQMLRATGTPTTHYETKFGYVRSLTP